MMTNTGTSATTANKKFIKIDEEGYFQMDNLRVSDAEIGRSWMQNIFIDDRGRVLTKMNGEEIFVEAFDEPYIAKQISKNADGSWTIQMPYAYSENFKTETLSLDEWDRFHGTTERGVPFVLSREAQAELFNIVDEFDDESVTIDGQRIATNAWLLDNPEADTEEWWTNVYQTEEPRWELNRPAPALEAVLPTLKLSPSRVLVMGAGSANDAAFFASQGHIVTAVDISPEAIARGKAKYGHLTNLKFIQADLFKLPAEMHGSFDIVFEHTCYCAIKPSRRNELVRKWRRLLTENGHILGVFFVTEKRSGPPYGGSEWEIRARLGKGFRPLYWMRWQQSIDKRQGQELLVYAQKVPQI